MLRVEHVFGALGLGGGELDNQRGRVRFWRRWAQASKPEHPATWAAMGYTGLEDTIRSVCTQCDLSVAVEGASRTVAVTSAQEREGRSTIARALAISLAHDHARDVLLLEADLLRPSLAGDLALPESPGLSELLSSKVAGSRSAAAEPRRRSRSARIPLPQEADLLRPSLAGDLALPAPPGLSELLSSKADCATALRPTRLPNLWALTAGAPVENPSRLLRSVEFGALVARLRERFAFIVLDLPALLSSSDAAVVARLTDVTVLVVRTGVTEKRAIVQAKALLGEVRVHGVVMNRYKSAVPGFAQRLLGA